MRNLPNGTVTFLFTDIEGSTNLAHHYPDQWESLRARHHAILQSAMDVHNGYVFQIIGDAFCVAFSSSIDAVNAALEAQRCLLDEAWAPAPVKVRIGIHSGTAQLQEDGQYTGYATLACTQRIMSAGHGGQTLLSGATRELVRDSLPSNGELMDMGERRLKDLQRPERLYQLSASGLPATFPPLKTLDSYPNNLPVQLTTFIGREQEIAEVKQELQVHRLVTLTGPGGAGKTRLSLEVGAACLEQYKNGVWFVELARLTDPSRIISAVLSAFGIHEKENDILFLANYIGTQSLLLILDNCEHLVEECARLADRLSSSCPNLRMLASSREAFSIAGEQPYHVPSLPFPDPKKLPAMEEIANCEAVQLFVERVKTYFPSFSVTDRNASSITQICCRLDGIPLALELAAARVKVMSVEQLASRLGDVFNLLTNGSRNALPRQQTLRALIEWSYDLLTESEKLLFRRLAVFSGGWSLEAAESICGMEATDYVLENLARLVDKSLVNKEELDGEARFRMLETIRQYAEFKMFASEEVEEVRNRHRDWFMQLAETAEPKLRTGEQLVWLNRLETEHDNLRAAMQWSIEQKHVEQALRIPSALAYFWEIHGHAEEGRNWFHQAIRLEAPNPERNYQYAWATAVSGLLSLSYFLPDAKNYKSQAEEALDIFRERTDLFRAGRILHYLAVISSFAGDIETALSTLREELNYQQTAGNPWGVGECFHCMAHLIEEQGKIEESHTLYHKSVELIKQTGDRWSLYHPVGDIGRLAAYQGDMKTALAVFQENLYRFQELGSREGISSTYSELGKLYYSRGEYQQAVECFQEAIALDEKSGNLAMNSLWPRAHLAYTILQQGDILKARATFKDSFRGMQKADSLIGIVFVTEGLASLNVHEAEFERAARLFAWADSIRNKIDNHRPPPEQASVEKDLAVIRSQLDDTECARFSTEGRAMTVEQAIALALEESSS